MNNIKSAVKAINKQKTIPTPQPCTTCSSKLGPLSWQETQVKADKIQNLIITERARQKLSQRELGRISGSSATTIHRAEKGLYISLNMLIRITTALGKELTLI